MLSKRQFILLIFLHLFASNNSNLEAKKPVVPNSSGRLVLIHKCCPADLYLDEWMDCVDSTEAVLDIFKQEMVEAGKRHESEYEIVQTNSWKECPEQFMREYEVMNILDDEKVYVLTDTDLVYDDEDEQDFTSVTEKEYECLDITHNPLTLIAVVCETEEQVDDKNSFIQKCCPAGEVLSANYSSCLPSKHAEAWISPRQILHPDTEKMTGMFTVRYGDAGGCKQEYLTVTDSVHSVLTDGTFFRGIDHPLGREPYHCVDMVLSTTGRQLMAITCIARGCSK